MGCLIRTLLAREQRRMRDQYEERLRELERERLTAEQDKAQVRPCMACINLILGGCCLLCKRWNTPAVHGRRNPSHA